MSRISLQKYNMSHRRRGKCLIFNNMEFQPVSEEGQSPLIVPPRPGSEIDARNLVAMFTGLGFDVIDTEQTKNKTAFEMKNLAKELAEMDHTDADCVAVVILSHGDREDQVWGTDAMIGLRNLFQPFVDSPTLVGKPKLFFIQACRGQMLDDGVDFVEEVQTDSGDETKRAVSRIPKQVDCLYAYSTPPGHYSFRNRREGSCFIQSLCEVFKLHGATEEIHKLLTMVNMTVAYKFESFTTNRRFSEKKQVSSFESMLTKELYFKSEVDGGF